MQPTAWWGLSGCRSLEVGASHNWGLPCLLNNRTGVLIFSPRGSVVPWCKTFVQGAGVSGRAGVVDRADGHTAQEGYVPSKVTLRKTTVQSRLGPGRNDRTDNVQKKKKERKKWSWGASSLRQVCTYSTVCTYPVPLPGTPVLSSCMLMYLSWRLTRYRAL